MRVKNEPPPYTHDLGLLAKSSGFDLGGDRVEEIAVIQRFNIEARYQRDKLALHKLATVEFTREWLDRLRLVMQSVLL